MQDSNGLDGMGAEFGVSLLAIGVLYVSLK